MYHFREGNFANIPVGYTGDESAFRPSFQQSSENVFYALCVCGCACVGVCLNRVEQSVIFLENLQMCVGCLKRFAF